MSGCVLGGQDWMSKVWQMRQSSREKMVWTMFHDSSSESVLCERSKPLELPRRCCTAQQVFVQTNILNVSSKAIDSVTRFGENSCLKVFGKFLMVYFLFGKMLSLLWQIYITGLIIIVANSQILKIILTIWSHCNCITF